MGIIFNIQKFCVNDGPGIRTTVFFKGCPLRCRWCHNPESQSCEQETMFENEMCGKQMTVQEVLGEVLKDKIFYENSGGGLTLSGGEPLMQFDFAYELLKEAKKENVHTCIETCGFCQKVKILKIAEVTDIFLFDWKISDNKLHKEYIGTDNDVILENLKEIDSLNSKIILRCPIIPKVNDTEDHFNGIAKVANSLKNILAIEIEPYHSLGSNKYKKLGLSPENHILEVPTESETEEWIKKIQRYTKINVKKA